MFPVLRPVLQALDAEAAHHMTIRMLRISPRTVAPAGDPRLRVKAFGLDFLNPLGLAAGFDKNAEVPDALLAMELGFVEVGTLTPHPQAGNPRPRLFRLKEDGAVINRLGFNNEGHAAALVRLAARKSRPGIVGVNLGANRDSADRIADYVKGVGAFSSVADYLAVNISSPNTPGLRALQSRSELQALLDRLNEARAQKPERPPMLLKIAPDLREDELEDIAICCGNDAVDGIIVSNTTISRTQLRSVHAKEQGGLSGAPLFTLSTRQLARLYLLTRGSIPLIGAGGIGDAEQAWTKLLAGATLLQLYSALVYKGPGLIGEILRGLARRLESSGTPSLSGIIGRDAATLAHQGLSGT
ncbi:MAG: quinone-dependent dihydroorotate dehydrogenase [Rhizobiales bacterium]|nr:quinone-dependent dihydroorotate dehydrogenase [Hyphomicrobiales bacterium]